MTKPKAIKKLRCPASTKDVAPPHELLRCKWGLNYEEFPVIALEAQRELLLHLRQTHNFYWKRHGKKLVTRFNKRVAMRG